MNYLIMLRQISRHPRIDVENIYEQFHNAILAYTSRLPRLRKEHPNLLSSDKSLDQLAALFDGKTGAPFTEAEIDKISREGEHRYKAQIPPGFKDRSKDGRDKYGDLLIWKQIIDHYREVKVPL